MTDSFAISEYGCPFSMKVSIWAIITPQKIPAVNGSSGSWLSSRLRRATSPARHMLAWSILPIGNRATELRILDNLLHALGGPSTDQPVCRPDADRTSTASATTAAGSPGDS